MLLFMDSLGALQGYTVLPAATDEGVGPPLLSKDGFGQSLAGYQDLDSNGLREVVVGAPGDDNNSSFVFTETGAVYIIFLRRRRWSWVPFDWVGYWAAIFVPLGCCFCSFVSGIAYFFYYFRRRPDEVERIVKMSGYEMKKERTRYKKPANQVYADNYTV